MTSTLTPGTRPGSVVHEPGQPMVPDDRRDLVSNLTLWVVLLFGISAFQVISPLGAIGQPSLVMAMALALVWLADRALPTPRLHTTVHPLRWMIYVYTWYMLATWVIARMRSMTTLEMTGSSREAITILAMAGVALVVMDGVTSLERLDVLLRRTVWGGAFMAATGVMQFITGDAWTIKVPGLSLNQPLGFGSRSIFNRPLGTALHPIEFGVVLAALLPLTLHYALESEPGSRGRRRAIVASVLVSLAVPLSISRSGIVALVVALGVVAVGWSWRRRAQGALVGLMALPVLWLVIPGLVGTLRSLFVNLEYDPSVQARIDRFPKVLDLIRERPFFGLGIGTFSVEDYFLTDNELYATTIETGFIGILVIFLLVGLAVLMAITSSHHELATQRTKNLGYSIAAGICALVVTMATFDAFYYVIYRGVLFLFLGAAGALWRLTRIDDTVGRRPDG